VKKGCYQYFHCGGKDTVFFFGSFSQKILFRQEGGTGKADGFLRSLNFFARNIKKAGGLNLFP